MAISTKDWKTSDTDFDISGVRRGGFASRGRRKNKNALLAFASITFLLIFLVLIAVFMQSRKPKEEPIKERVVVVEQKPQPIPMVNVLVPVQEIEAGKQLDPSMFKMVEKPAMAVSEDSVRSFDEIKGL